MHTSHEHEGELLLDDLDFVDEDVYDDPYEVVMYDIDVDSDDLYALIDMLSDDGRSWYARRRLNALAASGPLSALVAAVIIDSLGRRWDPLLHPRDRFGQFIETGGFIRWLMNGVNLRGQVSRIDSDGNIHVRSVGNDSIADGTTVRFKPQQASKLISIADPKGDLTPDRELPAVDLDADIPDFPEATATQRRVYNALKGGDFPAADLDVYRSPDDGDLSGSDFASEIKGLQDRGLIEIETGDSPRVSLADKANLDVRDIGDDEIDEIGDDETPDLDDSPGFTLAQRVLLDRLVEADRGEGDGVGRDELEGVDDNDLQALIDAGAVEENEDGRMFLENPEGDGQPAAETSEPDVGQEIFEASQIINDLDAQEAFQHYAEELARPGDENNIPLPEGLSPAKQRNAEAAANKWWEERNGVSPRDEDTDVAETDAPEASQTNPKEVLNSRNQALADTIMGEEFPGQEFEEWLESDVGVEYASAVKRLFDAEDYEEAGFSAQADAERDRANRALRKLGAPEEDIEGWPTAIQNMRNADRESAAPDDGSDEQLPEPAEEEVEPDVLVEDGFGDEPTAEDAPLDEVPSGEDIDDEPDAPATWEEFSDRIAEEGPADDFYGRLEQENRIADELGLNLLDDDAPWSWENMAEEVGFRPAELLFKDADGSIGRAGPLWNRNGDQYVRTYENELLAKFEANQDNPGPEVMRLRQAGLIESDEGSKWRLTDAGRQRLGIEDELPEEVDAPEDVVDEDVVPDASAPEDENVPEDVVPEDVPDAVPEDAPEDVPEPDVAPDVAPDEQPDDVADVDALPDVDAEEIVDDAVAPTTDAMAAPVLPDPADPNDATPGFQRTGGQSGLNAGGFYDVTEDNGPLKAGDKVYIKNGRSPEHAQNEFVANRLYALAGVDVPEMYLGDSNDRLVSKIIDDLSPLDIHDPAQQSVTDRVRDEFAVDAWIANWDGMNPGNTLVGPDGTPYRIDVGSAMEFRAQGGAKGLAFADTVEELTNLRNPSVNYDAGIVFGPMSDDEVKASVGRLAAIDPDEIRSTILAGRPGSDVLAEKMVTRRSNALAAFGVPDPFATGDSPDAAPEADVDAADAVDTADAVPAPTQQMAKAVRVKTPAQIKKLTEFQTRTNPHLEPQYDDNGTLITPDGSSLSLTQYYHTGKGGEGKHGLVVEVHDQERYPGLVTLEYQDGTRQVRHVLGVNSGKGGLRPSSQDAVDEWERQARVVGEKAEDIVDPADFPMDDGSAPISGTQVMFDVGGEDTPGMLLYFDYKYDNGGRAYIIPEGGGKVVARPVRNIRAQTQNELDADASPIVAYEPGAVAPQFLPPPRFDQAGNLLSRYDQPINIGDWMSQRAGGDSLVGEVIDIPDQYLYPGWVTLRFPDGEVRSRHVEGFTATGASRGAGGLIHATEPDPDTWARVRRVKGEEGDVLSYDFSSLDTLDGTQIQVGQPVFGTGRMNQPIAGLLIRINPHMKRGGEVVPTGFVWQNGQEIPVDVAKITNTAPPSPTPQPFVPGPSTTTTTSRPSPARIPPRSVTVGPGRQTTPSTPGATRSFTTPDNPAPRPTVQSSNPPVAYTAGTGSELSDDVIQGLDTSPNRLYSSPRTNGVHAKLAAIYEAQNFDTLPQVVSQAEYARLIRDEGYVPILRSVHHGIEPTTNLPFTEAFKYGAYYAGNGVYGNGSYFAYGSTGRQESSIYGPNRIYAAVRPSDLRLIDIQEAKAERTAEYNALIARLNDLDPKSDEAKAIKKRLDLTHDIGQWAALKGYDAIIVPFVGRSKGDSEMKGEGYFVLLNRGAAIVSDQHFPDNPDIFMSGLPAGLADQALAQAPDPGVV